MQMMIRKMMAMMMMTMTTMMMMTVERWANPSYGAMRNYVNNDKKVDGNDDYDDNDDDDDDDNDDESRAVG